jgi:excisionase family DNA binding protein
MDNKLLTVEEVSKIIQIHPMTIRLWLREGRIKGTRLGRVWRISEEQLEEIRKGD